MAVVMTPSRVWYLAVICCPCVVFPLLQVVFVNFTVKAKARLETPSLCHCCGVVAASGCCFRTSSCGIVGRGLRQR
jgi:hypothetical protein